MLEQTFFNFHDVVLILICIEALLFGTVITLVKLDKFPSSIFLSLFLFAKALVAFDALIYWCLPFKIAYFSNQYFLFFAFKFALLVQGPILFLYVKSLIYSDFQLKLKDYLHFIPLLIFPFVLIIIFQDIGQAGLVNGIGEYNYYFNSLPFRLLLNAQSLSIFIYSLLCLHYLYKYGKNITMRYSNIDSISLTWITALVVVYFILLIWELTAQFAHQFDLGRFAAMAGLSKNYAELIFINLLVLYAVAKAAQPSALKTQVQDEPTIIKSEATDPQKDPEQEQQFCEQAIETIQNSMTVKEYFLDHDINIDKLAEQINLPTKVVSKIINQHFKQNFFEFINYYRVEKAKALLETQTEKSMIEVMDLSGFNSKSTFNRLFKKQTNLTPSQYKEQVNAANLQLES